MDGGGKYSKIVNYFLHFSSFVNDAKLFFFLQVTRNTTPMYRTPEIIDLYSNFPIGEKQDIWVKILAKFSFLAYGLIDLT